MAGEEKFGYFRLSEGTEGEDGSLSSGCGWLEVLCVWRWELTTNCSSFFCEESGEVIGYYRSVGRWWRGTEERIKCSEEITCVWSTVDLVVENDDLAVWTSAEKDESKDLYLLRSNGSFYLHHVLSAALRLVRCSRRTLDKQELEGAARAGLEERGQMLSRQEVKVEHKVSVAAFTSRDEKWVGEGREEDTTEERWEGEKERSFV